MPQVPWSFPMVLDFTLTSVAAGAFLVALTHSVQHRAGWEPVGRLGALGSLLFFLGPPWLLLDPAEARQAWRLLMNLDMTSPLGWGFPLMGVCGLTVLMHAWAVLRNRTRDASRWGLWGIFPMLVLPAYGGCLLTFGGAWTFARSGLIPLLFVETALLGGVATVVLLARVLRPVGWTPPNPRVLDHLGRWTLGLLLGEVVLLVGHVLFLAVWIPSAQASLRLLMTELWGIVSIGIVGVVGVMVPVFILGIRGLREDLDFSAAAAFFTLIGVFAVRYVAVVGAQAAG